MYGPSDGPELISWRGARGGYHRGFRDSGPGGDPGLAAADCRASRAGEPELRVLAPQRDRAGLFGFGGRWRGCCWVFVRRIYGRDVRGLDACAAGTDPDSHICGPAGTALPKDLLPGISSDNDEAAGLADQVVSDMNPTIARFG